MRVVLYNVLFLLAFVREAAGYFTEPGIYTVLSEQFFQRETENVFEELEQELLGSDTHSVSGRDGRVRWGLDGVDVYHFDGPETNVELTSGNDRAVVTLELGGATIKARFNWWGSYNAWFTNIKTSGQAHIRLYGVSLTKSVALDRTSTGRLELDSRGCSLSSCCDMTIEDVEASWSGGFVSWLLDTFSGAFENNLRTFIWEKSCTLIDDLIHDQVNAQLAAVSTHSEILSNGLLLNYTLRHLETVGECLVVGMDGGISLVDGPRILTPLTSSTPDITCEEDYDFTTIVSKSSIQSLMDSVFPESLVFHFNQDMIRAASLMFSPGFFARAGDHLLQHYIIRMQTNITATPSVTISGNNSCIFVHVPMQLDMTMLHPNANKRDKLRVRVAGTASIGITIDLMSGAGLGEEVFVVGSVTGSDFHVSDTTFNEEDYELETGDKSFQLLVTLLMDNLLLPRINQHLQNGIPTNFGEVFHLTAQKITYLDDHIKINGDIYDWSMPE